MTDSQVKLDMLVGTQESFNTSHRRVAFKYDEDTVSLVEEQFPLVEELTLDTLEVSLSNNSNSSAGNASTAFEYECYEIEDLRMTHLNSITMGLRLRFLNKNHP